MLLATILLLLVSAARLRSNLRRQGAEIRLMIPTSPSITSPSTSPPHPKKQGKRLIYDQIIYFAPGKGKKKVLPKTSLTVHGSEGTIRLNQMVWDCSGVQSRWEGLLPSNHITRHSKSGYAQLKYPVEMRDKSGKPHEYLVAVIGEGGIPKHEHLTEFIKWAGQSNKIVLITKVRKSGSLLDPISAHWEN